jgi:hypothetical protein
MPINHKTVEGKMKSLFLRDIIKINVAIIARRIPKIPIILL